MRTVDDNSDGFEAAFREWDESAVGSQVGPFAQGTQPHALSLSARTTTLSDPVTTARLAASMRRPVAAGRTLEEALLALANGIPELRLA
jgi:hypothetical protein